MAINIYDLATNPITGETFQVVSVTPYALTMQWTVKPNGYAAFEHVHYNQDEIFYVKSGELRVVIEDEERIAGPGQKIVVLKGKRHIAFNNKNEDLDTLVEYRPVLDHEKFVQCLNGLINDGYLDKNGGINVPMMGYFLKRMKCKAMTRPTSIPAPAFKLALNAFYLLGTLKGWSKLYNRYTK